MKNYKMMFVLATLPFLAFSFDAEARGRGGKMNREGGPAEMMKELNLSAEQREKLVEIRKANRAKMETLRDKMNDFHKKMEEALQSNASADEARKLHKEYRPLRQEMEDQRFEQILKVREILTPDQRKKFRQGMKARSGKGRGMGGPGPMWDNKDDG